MKTAEVSVKAWPVWPFYLAYIYPFSIIVGHSLGWLFSFLAPVATFVLVTLLELFITLDPKNPLPDEMDSLEKKFAFRSVL